MTKRYEKYKDSGSAWIGEIPDSWEATTFRYFINILTDYTANGSFGDLSKNVEYIGHKSYARLIRLTDLREDLNNANGVWVNEKAYNYLSKSSLYGGELLLANVGAYSGYSCIMPKVDYPATLAPNMFLIKQYKKDLNTKYLWHLLSSKMFFNYLQIVALSSAQPKLNKENIRQTPIVIPPIIEQEQIAKYLDWKCGEVDRIVEVRERQIKLLAELRTSVISRAVTRGLNPNAPLKDSGIEWIGQIPEHWEVFPIKHLCRNEKYSIKTGPFGTQLKGDDLQESGDVRVYNQKNVIYGCFDDVRFYVSNQKAERLKSFYTQPNDFLITSRGTIGRAAIIPNDFEMGILHPCLIALRLSKYKVLNKWLLYFVNDTDCFKTGIQLASNATTIEVIYTETLKNTPVAIPSITEQQQIADYLDKKTAEIDSTINKFKVQIDKLKEYRQALITEVVTGKIDVRGIEIPTPKSN